MRLSVLLPYDTSPRDGADLVPDLERDGVDGVWVPELWGFDAPTQMGYIAALTSSVRIGAGIMNVFSRSPTLIAQTIAGLDHLSRGRAVLGIGTSGPQVIEGWHGVAFDDPTGRIADTVSTVRAALRRELIDRRSAIPAGHGRDLGKPLRMLNRPERDVVPIAIAALGPRSVRYAACHAEMWLPLFYLPERAGGAFGKPLAAGAARRDPQLPPLEVIAGGVLAIDRDVSLGRDVARATLARYIGGMGARGANFYLDLAERYGFGDIAGAIQDRYLAGEQHAAQVLVPDELIALTNLIGSRRDVQARLDAYAAAGVAELMVSTVGRDPRAHVRTLRALI